MSSMKQQMSVSMLVVLAALLAGQAGLAQSLVPGAAPFSPAPPPPPPSPKIEVPKLPQLDARPSFNYKPPPRTSFSDRITRCLDDAAGAGLNPADRATYSRSCANQ
jgi:hypothetical protein